MAYGVRASSRGASELELFREDEGGRYIPLISTDL